MSAPRRSSKARDKPAERLDFGILLALAYTAFVDELRAELTRRGYRELNRSFGYVARALAEGPLTLKDLAGRLELSAPGALKIVDDMAAHGYLERLPDRTDGRAKRLRLSRRGKSALDAARRFHARFEEQLVGRHGLASVHALRALLSNIVEGRALAGAPPALRPV